MLFTLLLAFVDLNARNAFYALACTPQESQMLFFVLLKAAASFFLAKSTIMLCYTAKILYNLDNCYVLQQTDGLMKVTEARGM